MGVADVAMAPPMKRRLMEWRNLFGAPDGIVRLAGGPNGTQMRADARRAAAWRTRTVQTLVRRGAGQLFRLQRRVAFVLIRRPSADGRVRRRGCLRRAVGGRTGCTPPWAAKYAARYGLPDERQETYVSNARTA